MEASRGKGLSKRGSVAVGKENICPLLSSREHLNASRSPLPEGFPRAPLQDITHILSPSNILLNDDGGVSMELGQCRRGCKRSKFGAETHTSICITRSESELSSSEAWRGLRQCVTLQATNSNAHVVVENENLAHLTHSTEPNDAHVAADSNLTNVVESENLAHLTQSTELIEEAKVAHAVEIEEEALICRETRDTGVLKTEVAAASHLVMSLRTKPKRSVRLNTSAPATRASLRSSSEKQKMSSLMKFR